MMTRVNPEAEGPDCVVYQASLGHENPLNSGKCVKEADRVVQVIQEMTKVIPWMTRTSSA